MFLDLTVILTCKNRIDHLLCNLASIRNNTHIPKVIIVDFGNIPPITLEKVPYIKVLRVTEDTDLFHKSRALNIGLRHSRTKYVCFSDVDEVYATNFFKVLFKTLNNNKNCFVTCRTYKAHPKDARHICPENITEEFYKLKKIMAKRRKKVYGSGCCQALCRKHAIMLRGYDEKFRGWGCEDSDFARRAKISGLNLLKIHDKTSMIHLPHPARVNYDPYYSAELRMKNLEHYRGNAKKKITVVNVNGNWGKISLSEKNTTIIKNPRKFNKFFNK